MRSFEYYQPTEIRFGAGRVAEVGEAVVRFGKRCLLVSESLSGPLGPLWVKVRKCLEDSGVSVAHTPQATPRQ